MELDPVLLSRIQFGFVVSFHIIFPSFTIGLAAWLATIEGMRLATGRPIYRRVFDFWLKIFSLSFAMGVVSGIVMAFQFGTNWSVLSERTGPIQGPLLGYESFTAFMLEATFFGVVLLGRDRVPPWFYFVSCCMVSLGTMFSSFWILCNNTWMQVPLGHVVIDGRIVPQDWWAITTGPIVQIRWPHMLLAAFLTSGMSIIATGAWHMLRGRHLAEARVTRERRERRPQEPARALQPAAPQQQHAEPGHRQHDQAHADHDTEGEEGNDDGRAIPRRKRIEADLARIPGARGDEAAELGHHHREQVLLRPRIGEADQDLARRLLGLPPRLDRCEFRRLIMMDVVAGQVADPQLQRNENGDQAHPPAQHGGERPVCRRCMGLGGAAARAVRHRPRARLCLARRRLAGAQMRSTKRLRSASASRPISKTAAGA
jgi:Cytochrome bd terminal oxidase subunit I